MANAGHVGYPFNRFERLAAGWANNGGAYRKGMALLLVTLSHNAAVTTIELDHVTHDHAVEITVRFDSQSPMRLNGQVPHARFHRSF